MFVDVSVISKSHVGYCNSEDFPSVNVHSVSLISAFQCICLHFLALKINVNKCTEYTASKEPRCIIMHLNFVKHNSFLSFGE